MQYEEFINQVADTNQKMEVVFRQIKELLEGVVDVKETIGETDQEEKIKLDLEELIHESIKIDPSTQEVEEAEREHGEKQLMEGILTQDDGIEQ